MTGKIIVKEPYYATQCEHCGWYGSSEDCGEIRYDDDADVTCPKCFQIIAGDSPDPKHHHRFKTWDGEI
ncbi:MAG TPA: hypothetical protein VKA94_02785 [Hyphomicrobiales bacterium]|nr:hypothetical protein [Hyphomicrobiales bacterium]